MRPRDALGLDVIGDVHGQLETLRILGRKLGYDVDQGWSHPADRELIFLGDLVDRGPHGLETAELVLGLANAGRATCLMGNHEYNLVCSAFGLAPPRTSNRTTLADLAARPARWDPVIEGLAKLPLALETEHLRLVHAVWHRDCIEALRPVLQPSPETPDTRLVLGSPFAARALRSDLPPEEWPPGGDRPHEILIKGHEERAAEPFADADGQLRSLQRCCWWQDGHTEVPRDKRVVFGHYWCLPPRAEAPLFAPPHPTGHPRALAWIARQAQPPPVAGRFDVPAAQRFVCIDYNGLLPRHGSGCVGAYRWPEAEVVWAAQSLD